MTTAATAEFLALQKVVAGRYSLERELGRGGMGVVFLARDVALDRLIAMKLLPPVVAGRPDLRQRFLREARTADKLSHPNIVPLHAVEEHGDLVFFTMGFVDGETLGQRVRRAGPLALGVSARLIQEVAWALAYAHGRGVIHRDVKPDNILLEKGTGRALVTDFGIARVAEPSGLTGHHEILGTAQYMSPEQASGDTIDGRADLYSLGVTAYFALTGRVPFDGASLPAVMARVLTDPAPRVSAARTDLPPRLANAIDRCLSKDPGGRFATGEELADAVADSHPAAKEVPPQIRILLRGARDIDGLVVTSLFAALAAPDVIRGLWPNEADTLFLLGGGLAIGYFAVPFLLIRSAREVLSAGYGLQDTRAALANDVRALIEESPLWERPKTRRLLFWGGALTTTLTAGFLALTWLFDWAGAPVGESLVGLACGLVLLLGSSAMRGLERFHEDPASRYGVTGIARVAVTGIGLHLLDGGVGRWVFRVAHRGLRGEQHSVHVSTQPTEVVLGGAVATLFDALPPDVRSRFADVPDAIARLERDAASLRDRQRALERALGQIAPALSAGGGRRKAAEAELAAARDAARDRLGAAVAALEDIRLDLIRLQAGVGSADDLSADLERAREINAAVNAELAGRAEVRKLLDSRT